MVPLAKVVVILCSAVLYLFACCVLMLLLLFIFFLIIQHFFPRVFLIYFSHLYFTKASTTSSCSQGKVAMIVYASAERQVVGE